MAWLAIFAEGFYTGLCIFGIVRKAKQGLPLEMESVSEIELRGISEG